MHLLRKGNLFGKTVNLRRYKMPKDTISSSFVDMNNLEMSNEVKPLFDKVVKHVKENVDPISDEFYKHAEENENRSH